MADKKITQLTEATSVGSSDLVPVVTDPSTDPVTKKITISNLKTSLEIGVMITVSATAPSSPDVNDLWVDTS